MPAQKPTRNPRPPAPDSLGFQVYRGPANLMVEAHQHTDIELNFVLRGWIRYFMAGRFTVVPSEQLVAIWAGIPHRVVEVAPGAELIWVTVPLAWVLSWGLKESFVGGLLHGELLTEPRPDSSEADRILLGRWGDDFESEGPDRRAVAAIEVEARMHRLALAQGRSVRGTRRTQSLGPVDQMTAFISAHYTDEIDVSDIAKAANLHPNYAMALFKKSSGMALHEYVVRLRVWNAQRLLLTTDEKILVIMLESGFKSASRFYETFRKIAGASPQDYRARHRPV